jgi:hypothetical protein
VGLSIVTSSPDGTVRRWDAVFQPLTKELADVGAPVAFVAFGETAFGSEPSTGASIPWTQ